jgi:hypothetical protein
MAAAAKILDAPTETIRPRWTGTCVVAATGPSLTREVATACRGYPAIAIKEAWRLFPDADVLFACDATFWDYYRGVPEFRGEKWSVHDDRFSPKLEVAATYDLRLVEGRMEPGFSTDSAAIHYGCNSGFQALNLAILFGAKRIVLVGFDMQGGHFFGKKPYRRAGTPFGLFLPQFERAAASMPTGIEIVNATPGSVLKAFPPMDLAAALN